MTEPEHNLDGIDPEFIQEKPKRATVQISREAYEMLTEMAGRHPHVRLSVEGQAERTGLRGVSLTEMVGLCIHWTWEALQEQQGSKDTAPVRRSP